MKTIAFFNNKGGVGKTSLTYHLAWMFSELGIRTLAVDLDPQANLTSMLLPESDLESLWNRSTDSSTIFSQLTPILKGTGDIGTPISIDIMPETLWLLPGDLGLSLFEDKLSESWPKCLDRDESAFRVTTALYRMLMASAEVLSVKIILMDVGPNLGAINRSAMIAAEHVFFPLSPDLFSLQGLNNVGPTLRKWRQGWRERRERAPKMGINLPLGSMNPEGYIVQQHSMRDNRPVKAYQRWMDKIPAEYRNSLLDDETDMSSVIPDIVSDPHCVATLKHYRSLMPLAMEARKPMFLLQPADGAIGAHVEAVKSCYSDFKHLAIAIGRKAGLPDFLEST